MQHTSIEYTPSETDHTDDGYEITTGREWVKTAAARAVPKMLFGELWIEGEVAMLYGGRGSGKSLLAAQIAESIARGRAIEPFELTARKQKVVYLDVKLTDRQFAMRYSSDRSAEGETIVRPYSYRFHRVVPSPERLAAIENGLADVEVARLLRSIVERTGARVVVIDNLTYFKQTAEGVRETARLVRAIKRLA